MSPAESINLSLAFSTKSGSLDSLIGIFSSFMINGIIDKYAFVSAICSLCSFSSGFFSIPAFFCINEIIDCMYSLASQSFLASGP